jgi:hypothetical protein
MHPMFEPNQPAAGREVATPALLFQLTEDNPQMARVPAAQELLFPSGARALCSELGLNWWAALKLHEDGWLSFSPEHTVQLDEAQEAELRFVGTLVMAGCDRDMLNLLLAGLSRPYAYDLKRLYYDWAASRWRLLPDPRAHPEAAFTDWLELLVQTGDVASLTGIGELARDALSRVPPKNPLPESHSKEWRVTDDGRGAQE